MIQQASSRHCFVCGEENEAGLHMHFFETEGDASEAAPVVVAEYTVPARYQGYAGVTHGGIVATMLDEITSRTVLRGDPPRFVVTARLSVRYRKPVPVETPLRLIGRLEKDQGRVITAVGEIRGPGDVLLAEAEATMVQVDPEFFGKDAIDPQDWQVYPAESPENSDGGRHDS